LGGLPAVIDDYLATIGSITLRERQVYAIKSNSAYVLTFATLPKDWDSFLLTFDKVRGSFTFNPSVAGVNTVTNFIAIQGFENGTK